MRVPPADRRADRLHSRRVGAGGALLELAELLVRLFRQRLDRVPGCLDLVLLDEHLQRRVVGRLGIVLGGQLKLGCDARRLQQILQLLGFSHVAGNGDLDEARHDASDPIAAFCERAPERMSSGVPRSGNGMSTMSKSRGTTVSGKTSRASSTTSWPKYRVDRWVSASSRTPASCATSAASPAVEWSVSCARSRSSARNVASWTRTSAP